MAPTWVMLQRSVSVNIEDGYDEAAAAAAGKQQDGPADPSVQDLLGSLKPDNRGLHTPPRISTFELRGRTTPGGVDLVRLAICTSVACADKNLLVLYGGKYEGVGSSSRGCYLVYDAAACTSSPRATVPPIPYKIGLNSIGEGAVVLRRRSSYLLAELASTTQRDLPHAELYLWRSDSDARWTMKEVRLPREVAPEPGKHRFSADATFSMGASSLCWVDLLQGIIVCDNPERQDPHFRFIPLPDECATVGSASSDNRHHIPRPRMHEYRSVRYIGGEIKLVAMEGLVEGWASDQFRVAIWTLKSTVGGGVWERGDIFRIQDIWAKDKYQDLKLPRHTPSCPVLCESDVVYTVVNDVELKDIFIGRDRVRTELIVKGQYVLELDMQRNNIISIAHVPPEDIGNLMPNLFATDFTTYMQSQEESCETGMQKLKVPSDISDKVREDDDEAMTDTCKLSCRITQLCG